MNKNDIVCEVCGNMGVYELYSYLGRDIGNLKQDTIGIGRYRFFTQIYHAIWMECPLTPHFDDFDPYNEIHIALYEYAKTKTEIKVNTLFLYKECYCRCRYGIGMLKSKKEIKNKAMIFKLEDFLSSPYGTPVSMLSGQSYSEIKHEENYISE